MAWFRLITSLILLCLTLSAWGQSHTVYLVGDSANTFLPDGGCPGPVEIELSEEVTLIILDTQWLLHPWEKPQEIDGCEVGRYNDVFAQLEEMVRRNDYKTVIVAAHHPMS